MSEVIPMAADIAALRSEVEAYLLATGRAASQFGRAAVGDPKFVFDLRAGREPRSATVAKVRLFIAANPAPETQEAAA